MERSKTLVLNQGYEPLMVVSWKRAFLLVWLEKAEAVVTYPGKIYSSTKGHVIPAVIRLVRRVKNFRRGTSLTRKTLFERDGHVCQYCGEKMGRDKLTMDHVLPKSRGGRKTWENIVTCCLGCNNAKGDRTPKEAKMRLLQKPKKPSFTQAVWTPDEWKPYLWS